MGKVQEVLEQMAIELHTSKLPQEVHVCVHEKKPKTVVEVKEVADAYLFVWKHVNSRYHPPKAEGPQVEWNGQMSLL